MVRRHDDILEDDVVAAAGAHREVVPRLLDADTRRVHRDEKGGPDQLARRIFHRDRDPGMGERGSPCPPRLSAGEAPVAVGVLHRAGFIVPAPARAAEPGFAGGGVVERAVVDDLPQEHRLQVRRPQLVDGDAGHMAEVHRRHQRDRAVALRQRLERQHRLQRARAASPERLRHREREEGRLADRLEGLEREGAVAVVRRGVLRRDRGEAGRHLHDLRLPLGFRVARTRQRRGCGGRQSIGGCRHRLSLRQHRFTCSREYRTTHAASRIPLDVIRPRSPAPCVRGPRRHAVRGDSNEGHKDHP